MADGPPILHKVETLTGEEETYRIATYLTPRDGEDVGLERVMDASRTRYDTAAPSRDFGTVEQLYSYEWRTRQDAETVRRLVALNAPDTIGHGDLEDQEQDGSPVWTVPADDPYTAAYHPHDDSSILRLHAPTRHHDTALTLFADTAADRYGPATVDAIRDTLPDDLP